MALAQVETILNQMKRSTCAQATVLIPAVGGIVVPECRDRVSLVITSDPTVSYTLSRVPGDTSGAGIDIPAASAPVVLSLATHGALVFGPFWASAGTFPLTLYYLESIITQT